MSTRQRGVLNVEATELDLASPLVDGPVPAHRRPLAVGAHRGGRQRGARREGLRRRVRAHHPRRPHPHGRRDGRVDDDPRLPIGRRHARDPGHPDTEGQATWLRRRRPGLVGRRRGPEPGRRDRAVARGRGGPAPGLRAPAPAHAVAGLGRRRVHRDHRADRGDGAARGGAAGRPGVRGRRAPAVPDPGPDGRQRRYAEAVTPRDPRGGPGSRRRRLRVGRRPGRRCRLGPAPGRAALLRHVARALRPDLVARPPRCGVRHAERLPGCGGPGLHRLPSGRGGRPRRSPGRPATEPPVAPARPRPARGRHRRCRGRCRRAQRPHRR